MKQMNKQSEIFQIGSALPIIAPLNMLGVGSNKIRKIEIENIKREIIDFLKHHEKAYVSDIAISIDRHPRKIVQAIRELRDEGLISDD